MNNDFRKHSVRVAREEDHGVIARVVVTLHANMALSIEGPQDAAWTVKALENAADAVRAKLKREESTLVKVPPYDVDIPKSKLVSTG